MNKEDFTTDKQDSVKRRLADTAGVAKESVRIISISSQGSTRRHLLARGISVSTEVVVKDASQGASVALQITLTYLNAQMSKLGLPEVEALQSAEVVVVQFALAASSQTTPAPLSSSVPTAVMISKTIVDIHIEHAILLSNGQGVMIPSGSLSTAATISVEVKSWAPVAQNNMTLESDVLYFSPSDTTFMKPVTLVINFVGHASTGKRLAIHRFNHVTNGWDEKEGSVVSGAKSSVLVETSSFSFYAVLEVPERLADVETMPSEKLKMSHISVIVVASIISSFLLAMVYCRSKEANKDKQKTNKPTQITSLFP